MEYIIFQINGGAGKNIIATSVVRAINIQYPESKIVILTAHPDIWINNQRIHRIEQFGQLSYFYDNYIKDKDSLVIAQEPYIATDCIYRKKTLSQIWCEIHNIKWQGEHPELYFTNLEKDFVSVLLNKTKPILLMQPFGGAQTTHKYSWMRDMPPQLAQNIVEEFKNDYRIIQVKREDQIGLNGVEYLTLNHRMLALSLLFSDKRILIDSYMQHAAAALDLPSVVLWIGNSPTTFGYDLHQNITTDFIIGNTRNMIFDPFDITGDPVQLGTPPGNLFNKDVIINLIKGNLPVEDSITNSLDIIQDIPKKKSKKS